MNDSILNSAPDFQEQHTKQEEDVDVFGFYVEGLTLTLVCLFGLIGNTLSIVVLFQPAFRNSFSNFLRGLALCDVMFLAMAVLALGAPRLTGRGSFYREKMFAPWAFVAFGLLHTFRVGSVYATVAVTIERFLAVVFPLRNFPRKKYILPAALLLSVVYNIPKYFEIEMLQDPSTGYLEVHATQLRTNPTYIALYVVWSKFICTELIPYLTVLILNVVIVVRTVGAAAFRRQHGNFAKSIRSGTCKLGEETLELKESTVVNIMDCDATTSMFPGKDGSTASETVNDKGKRGMQKQQQHYQKDESLQSLPVPRSAKKPGSEANQLQPQEQSQQENQHQALKHTYSLSSNRHLSLVCTDSTKSKHSSGSHQPDGNKSSSNNSSSNNNNNNNRLILVHIGISVLFIACQSLKTIPDIYEMLFCSNANMSHCADPTLWIHPLMKLSHLLVCLNSSANFLLYLLHGERFRRAFTETFLCGKKLSPIDSRWRSHNSHV